MRKLLFLYAIISLTNYALAQDSTKQNNINTIFHKMDLEGVDTKQPLLYGYFFYDTDQTKLEKLAKELTASNYKVVRLEKTETSNFILHVEKIETHSRASLLQREIELEKLAKQFQVTTYDGWDVGNTDPTKPLTSKNDFSRSLINKSPEELFQTALELYKNETFDKAILGFQKCIDQNYKADTCYFKQAVSYHQLNDAKTAIKKLEEALKLNPKYYQACYNLAATCFEDYQYQKSIDYYQKAAKLNPEDDTVYYGIAASQFGLENLKECEANCRKALKLNPNNYNAQMLLEQIKNSK